MKIRCQENSIRLRLRKSDINQLSTVGEVVESVSFGDSSFSYSIAINGDDFDAEFVDGRLALTIPIAIGQQWIMTDQVGVEHQIQWPTGNVLSILIEKDFPCLDRPHEDKSDTFYELADQNPDTC